MSHLLGLNYGSGQQSAADLAKRVSNKGQAAMGSISQAEDAFNKQANGTVEMGPRGAVSKLGVTSQATPGQPYAGPNSMSENNSYSALAKNVADAEDSAKNLDKGGYGLAAEVNKETGLSPTQSAAGAYYMGVNNKDLKDTGRQFQNLQSALDAANNRSMATANMARSKASAAQDEANKPTDDAAPAMEETKVPDYGAGMGEQDDHGDLNRLLFGEDSGGNDNPWSDMHRIGMSMNPGDWATIAMGEAGVDVPVTTEIFGKYFSAGLGDATTMSKTWPQGRFLMAFETLTAGVPPVAKHAFINFLKANPDVMQNYLNMKNPGYMARCMRMWMNSWLQFNPDAVKNENARVNQVASGTAGNLQPVGTGTVKVG
jgi:hypothetical protein